ncbi:trigger factor, partial [Mobilibacterium timonense]
MKATFIEKDGDSKKFEMSFSPEEFDAAISRAYKANKDKFRIDGFRKGKAPRKLIENMYGQDIFYEEALNDLLQSGYPEALNDLDLDVIAQPQLDADEIKNGQDVVIRATVLCFPEREIKDYKGVEVEKQFKTVTDEELDDRLERERKRGARMESVEDRPAENDDTVIIDFTGYKDGEEFQGGKGENFELKLGSGQFIPGFEDQLVGAKPGDEVEVKVTFPEEYQAKELAGADAVFKVKVHEIKTEVLPELDDDFASDVSEFDTLEEYKKDLREQMQKAADDRAVEIMKDRLLESVYKSNGLELPQQMIENETDSMIQELQQQLQYQG